MKKRLLSFLLTASVLFGLLPLTAAAEKQEEAPELVQGPIIYRGLDNTPQSSALRTVSQAWNDGGTFREGVYEGYYAQLDESSQRLYRELQSKFSQPGVSQVKLQISIPKTLSDTSEISTWLKTELYPTFEALNRDHPEMPWLESGSFQPSYSYDEHFYTSVTITLKNVSPHSNNISEFQKAIANAVTEIDKKIGSSSDSYSKIRAIHDYLCDLILYEKDEEDNTSFDQSAYSALVAPNKTVCAGYAMSFKLLCDRYGIPCLYINGTANDGNHAWNYVRMDDLGSQWYAVDATWNDEKTYTSYYYFLSGSGTLKPKWDSNGKIVGTDTSFSENHLARNLCLGGQVTLPFPTLSTDSCRITPYIKKNYAIKTTYGTKLSDIVIGEKMLVGDLADISDPDAYVSGTWAWKDGSLSVGNVTNPKEYNRFVAIFTPDDPKYNAIEGRAFLTVVPADPIPEQVNTSAQEQNGKSVVQTTVTLPASESGGTASATISASAGRELTKQAAEKRSTVVVITPIIQSSVDSAQVTIPAAVISDLVRKTHAGIMVDTPVAQAAIPNSSLNALSGGDVTVSIQRQDSQLSVTVQAGQHIVSSMNDGLTVIAPAANAAPGTVAVLIGQNGSRTVIRKSTVNVSEGTLSIPLTGSARLEIIDNSKGFDDVPDAEWASNAIDFVSSHELFNGISPSTFGPGVSMSRGMVAKVLHNLENNPTCSKSVTFDDVPSHEWYADAVAWAAEQGLVSGYGTGTFGAADHITRQDLVVILWRYIGCPAAEKSSLSYSDVDKAAGYAVEALAWATEQGIISGRGAGVLDPQGLATRIEVAKVFQNLLECSAGQ